MKPKANLLIPVTVLLALLLFSTVEARDLGCLGRGGLECYCCSCTRAVDSAEAFSPCSCPCGDQSLPLSQDLLGVPAPPNFKLLIQRAAVIPAPAFRNFSSLIPQKPPPH